MGAWQSEGERRQRAEDSTRDRTALINQMLLAGVTLIAVLVAAWFEHIDDPSTFLIGTALVFAATAAAVLIPWKRLPTWAVGALPAVDLIAIAFIRDSAPASGVGLLWAFPAMWIGALFGIAGVVGATIGVAASLWVMAAANAAQPLAGSVVLLPLTVAALATFSHLSARRALAQRALLEKQSLYLQHSVERARRQEDLVTEVLDAVDFGVIRITPSGELVVTNEAHARLQDPDDESAPAFAADGVTPLEPAQAPFRRARAGETFENELVWYGAAGEGRRALAVTARHLVDLDGAHAGSIVVSRDVTSEELALRAREDLVASVSHELRTPLTSIIGYLELAMDDPALPEGARRDLAVAERNAARLLELVTDILALSATSRRGVETALDRRSTDVTAIVAAAVEAATPRAAERSIRIHGDLQHPINATIDAHRIRQIVDNLVSNAVKYGRDGGEVHVQVSGDGVHVWIAVGDDGTGIPESEQPQLFERFFRSDAVRNSSTHGSGLGLSISRELARAHGGDIFFSSRPGRGSTFTVRLPVDAEESE